MKRHAILIIAIAAAAYSPARCATWVPGTGAAVPPKAPQEVEAERAEQQRDAPQAPLSAPAPSDDSLERNSVRASPNSEPGELNVLVTGYVEQERRLGTETQRKESRRKNQGWVLIIAGIASMLGLGLGRLGLSMLSRTSKEEASRAIAEALAKDEDGISYGGEHRHYVIPGDTDEGA